jgi:hypothetical protein
MRPAQRFAQQQEALKAALDGRQARIWTALPGTVETFDPEAVTVEAQPAVKGVVHHRDATSEAVDLPRLVDVPVVFPRGGGVTLTFPVTTGDECLIVFASRCIDGWWQSGGSQLAPELRMHDLSDGFAIIGPQSQPNRISGISTDTAQLRTDDGKAYIELDPASHDINLKTAGNVNATISGTMTGNSAGWNITGDVNVNGSITATGDVIGAGISLDKHIHTGDSGGATGAPETAK